MCRSADAAPGLRTLASRALPGLRLGARLCRRRPIGRAKADLWTLRGAVELRSAHLPVLHERRQNAGYFVRDTGRPIPRVWLRRLQAVPEGIRRARGCAAGDGVGGFDCHLAARCCRTAARLLRIEKKKATMHQVALSVVAFVSLPVAAATVAVRCRSVRAWRTPSTPSPRAS